MTAAPTFLGAVCMRGHDGRRYLSCGQCVECAKAKSARQNAARSPVSPAKRDRSMAETAWRRSSGVHGAMAHLARLLKLRPQTVQRWRCVPLDHVFRVARLFGLAPEELRPDFFRDDPLRQSAFDPVVRRLLRESGRSPVVIREKSDA